MRRFCRNPVLALALAIVPSILHAQAPTITPNGDPSVADDTIYKLYVDSIAYPHQSTVVLLDDGVVQVERDGRTSTTYRQVVQVLRERAVAGHREQEFGYDGDRQRFRLNWARVLSTDGRVISEKPSQMQESDVPAAMDVPTYQHAKVVRASLSGVAPGTLVDVSYTIDTRTTDRTGDFFTSWSVTAGTTVKRSRFLVDAPADMPLTISERHLTFPRKEEVRHGRRIYTWATKDVKWVKPEQFAPDTAEQTQWISLSSPGHWSDVASWYETLAHDRELAPEALRDTVRRLVAHAKTRDDSIRAIHRWVAQDIRYVAIELGRGGYQPRQPATVMQTGFGDCKDKATLFVASLRAMGIDAYPVLLNAGGLVDPALTTIKAFNHEIAAVALPRASSACSSGLTGTARKCASRPTPRARIDSRCSRRAFWQTMGRSAAGSSSGAPGWRSKGSARRCGHRWTRRAARSSCGKWPPTCTLMRKAIASSSSTAKTCRPRRASPCTFTAARRPRGPATRRSSRSASRPERHHSTGSPTS
jgi:transglutaminase-like putative cysteine protease